LLIVMVACRLPPGGEVGYVIAELSNGWSTWTRGVGTVEEISGLVSRSLAS
jgi:hypothetical protein